MNTPPRDSGRPAPAEALANEAANVLRAVRMELRQRALIEVMNDGSHKVLAAAEILDAVIAGLEAEGDAELLSLRKEATRLRRKPPTARTRADEVCDFFDIFSASVKSDEVQQQVRARSHAQAAEHLANHLYEVFTVVADLFENLHRQLLPLEQLEARRPRLVEVLTEYLERDDQDDDWMLGMMRAVFRAWGATAKEAEGMTDFIRKRRS